MTVHEELQRQIKRNKQIESAIAETKTKLEVFVNKNNILMQEKERLEEKYADIERVRLFIRKVLNLD